jgi:hypothetical protein
LLFVVFLSDAEPLPSLSSSRRDENSRLAPATDRQPPVHEDNPSATVPEKEARGRRARPKTGCAVVLVADRVDIDQADGGGRSTQHWRVERRNAKGSAMVISYHLPIPKGRNGRGEAYDFATVRPAKNEKDIGKNAIIGLRPVGH